MYRFNSLWGLVSLNMQYYRDIVVFLLLFQLRFQCANTQGNVVTSLIDNIHYGHVDPELFMTTEEIIQHQGYPVETHDVQTDDGYILTIFRVPYGRVQGDNKTKPPILLVPGILCGAAFWLANIPEKNLPYILADAGYDVWLGSVRGTKYGDKHVSLKTTDKHFWDFAIDEYSKYDIPKIIDTMLNITGSEQIYYVGHSMGTTMAFQLLSSQTKYNQIVKAFIALAPVGSPVHLKPSLRFGAFFIDKFSWLLRDLGFNKFALPAEPVNLWARTLCQSPLKGICTTVYFTVFGEDSPQYNRSRAAVFIHHTMDENSLLTIAQFGQMIEAKKVIYRDLGKKANLEKYGQPKPPAYDLSKITTPIALFRGENDFFTEAEDVEVLASELKNVVLNYLIPHKKFNHPDFTWAIDVKTLLHDKVLETLEKFENGDIV